MNASILKFRPEQNTLPTQAVESCQPGSHQPTGFFFRRALRATDDPEKLRAIALTILLELEHVHAWTQEVIGEVPHQMHAMQSEVDAKPWLQVRSNK